LDRSTRRLVTILGAAATAGLLGAATLGGLELGRGSPGAGSPPATQHGAKTQLVAASSPAATAGATITVTATGNASGAPDTVTLQIGVSTTGATAAGTLDHANSEMATLQAVFLHHVGRPKLQTSNLSLNPTYDSSGSINGYSASEELTVTMHDIALAGQLVDAAAHAVGNDAHLDGVSFSISNTSSLMAAARAQAMQNAHLEASELAAGAGLSLGPIKTVTDQEQPPPPVYYPRFADSAALAGAGAVPLQGGTQQESVQVQVVYQLAK
jgi:uncharacterized protein YggE